MFSTRPQLLNLIEGLEQDLKEHPDPRQTELAVLRAALTAMDRRIIPSGPVQLASAAKVREGTKKERFRAIVGTLIDDRGGRVHRGDVIVRAKAEDLFPGSSDIDRDVSKYLSLDGTFAPDGDGYWKRKPQTADLLAPNEIKPQEGTPAA
jgi:hypothetical protein